MHRPQVTCATPPAISPPRQVQAALPGARKTEARLLRNMQSLRAKRANLKQRNAALVPERESTPDPVSDEEQKRIEEESGRKAIEVELRAYMTEGCIQSSTEATSLEVLSYWKVCRSYFMTNDQS